MSDASDRAVEKLEGYRTEAERKKYGAVIDYLIRRCGESDALSEDLLQEHKDWNGCLGYIQAEARKVLGSSGGWVDDRTVYEWAQDYFHVDDKAQAERRRKAEKKSKEDRERRERQDEELAAKKAEEKERRKEEAARKKADERSRRKEVEGQMDLFSMFGGADGQESD